MNVRRLIEVLSTVDLIRRSEVRDLSPDGESTTVVEIASRVAIADVPHVVLFSED